MDRGRLISRLIKMQHFEIIFISWLLCFPATRSRDTLYRSCRMVPHEVKFRLPRCRDLPAIIRSPYPILTYRISRKSIFFQKVIVTGIMCQSMVYCTIIRWYPFHIAPNCIFALFQRLERHIRWICKFEFYVFKKKGKLIFIAFV